MAVSNRFEVLDPLKDPGELWDTFICEILKAAECTGERPRFRSGGASRKTLS